MKGNFDRVIDKLLAHEGGYVNDRRDPGGETNLGISRRTYPKEDIRGMTKARAKVIYKRDFWDACRCDDLPGGVDYVVFDGAVHSGPSRSIRWLQQAVGATADGKIGPATLRAAEINYAPAVIERTIGFRLSFMRGLALWKSHGNGFQRRADEVRILALEMANHEPTRPDVEPAQKLDGPAWAWFARAWAAIVDQFTRKWRL